MMMFALLIGLVCNVVVGFENSGHSHLELAADPGVIHPILTKTLQLRCSVKNNKLQDYAVTNTSQQIQSKDQSGKSATRNSKSQGEAELSTLLSLVMTKTNKETGLNETIASVTGCDSPVIESKYAGTFQVEGNTESSPREGEQGFITLTWTRPLEEHAGEFYCEASALNSEKHSVIIVALLEIQAIEPKISDIVNYISTNDKHIFDLMAKVSELYEENQYLKNQTTALSNKIDKIPTPMIQSSTLTCTDQTVNFNPAFNNTPRIITSFSKVQIYNGYSYQHAMSVSGVTAKSFYITCNAGNWAHLVSLDWLAIGF